MSRRENPTVGGTIEDWFFYLVIGFVPLVTLFFIFLAAIGKF